MKIILTESQLKRVVESEGEVDNFYRGEYNPDSKKLSGYYYLSNEKNDSYQIVNAKELIRPEVWANGKKVYILKIHEFKLPKKFVDKLEEHPTKKGYFKFDLPYWLYKKENDLEIKRIPTDYKKFKQIYDLETLKKLTDPKVVEALDGLDTDEGLVRQMQMNYENLVNPKKSEVTPSKDSDWVWRGIRKKSGPEHLSNE